MKFISQKISGDGRGKTLGFPTINLIVPEDLDLENAVYAVWMKPVGESQKYRGVMHWGSRPTFDSDEKRVEVYIIDKVSEWVDAVVNWEVEVVERLRPVMKFAAVEDLISQIEKDVHGGSSLLMSSAD